MMMRFRDCNETSHWQENIFFKHCFPVTAKLLMKAADRLVTSERPCFFNEVRDSHGNLTHTHQLKLLSGGLVVEENTQTRNVTWYFLKSYKGCLTSALINIICECTLRLLTLLSNGKDLFVHIIVHTSSLHFNQQRRPNLCFPGNFAIKMLQKDETRQVLTSASPPSGNAQFTSSCF